jgi:hypothetical protein
MTYNPHRESERLKKEAEFQEDIARKERWKKRYKS